MNELELTKAAISGSRDAFCDLYDLYRVRLYRYAYYRLRDENDAEDAVSSCVLSAWEQIGKLRDPGAFAAWIFRILRGTCSRIIKDQMDRKKIVPLDVTGGAERSSDDDAEKTYEASSETDRTGVGTDAPDPETSAILMEALGTLDEENREMVLLSAVGGLTGSDIGEIYDMPQGTVRSRLSRSFAAMRKLMEAGDGR